jgi:CHAD domain-containing protein
MLQTMVSVIGPAPPRQKLHKYLRRLLKTGWQNYRTSFTGCRREFSEASVHRLRVESRRLLALLNLLEPLVGETPVELPRHFVKKLLRRLARLRDTQVQLLRLGEKLRAFPEAQPFRKVLRQRERRAVRRVRSWMRSARLGQLKEAMSALRQELYDLLADQPDERRHWHKLFRAVHQAFALTVQLHQQCHANDFATIHRMRVAFKEFRYLVELLQPVLPSVTKRALGAMHAFQGRMGAIQDAEVLLAALDKFGQKKPSAATAVQAFHQDVERRRDVVARQFLATAGRINEFWPLHPTQPTTRPHRPTDD